MILFFLVFVSNNEKRPRLALRLSSINLIKLTISTCTSSYRALVSDSIQLTRTEGKIKGEKQANCHQNQLIQFSFTFLLLCHSNADRRKASDTDDFGGEFHHSWERTSPSKFGPNNNMRHYEAMKGVKWRSIFF